MASLGEKNTLRPGKEKPVPGAGPFLRGQGETRLSRFLLSAKSGSARAQEILSAKERSAKRPATKCGDVPAGAVGAISPINNPSS